MLGNGRVKAITLQWNSHELIGLTTGELIGLTTGELIGLTTGESNHRYTHYGPSVQRIRHVVLDHTTYLQQTLYMIRANLYPSVVQQSVVALGGFWSMSRFWCWSDPVHK